MLWLIYFFIILITVIFLCRRYLGWFLSKLLARQFGWKSVRLNGIGLFRIQNVKIVICNGFSVEIHDLRLSSSFVNQEQRKPIMFTAADLRVESELSLIQNAAKESRTNDTKKLSPEKQARIMQWIQYVGARVHTSNIVLLDALPGCLLHITFDNLCLETYLEREGLQLELKCKLIQSKLFLRKKIDALLLDVSLAGSASVDVSEGTGKLKKFSVNLGNPRVIVYDGIIDYINNHTIRKAKNEPTSESSKDPALIRLLRRTPNINFDIDKLSIQFIASLNVTHPRRLSLHIQTIKMAADTSLQTASLQFIDCKITDNSADSHFHCLQFLATVISQLPAPAPPGVVSPSSIFQASVHIFTPFIVLYQHNLSWWINYGRGPHFTKLFGRKSSFEDDFAHQNIVIEKTNAELNNVNIPMDANTTAPKIIIDAELTDFQCQLRNSDSKTVVFGIDLATLAADHLMEEVEFGVESLWCHHDNGGIINERLALDPAKHAWGTTVAIGAGLAKFIKYRGNKQLCIQLDECQFEWEEEVITLIVDFMQSIRNQRIESPEDPDAPDPSLVNSDSWDSVDTLSSRSQLNDFLIQLSAKKLDCFFTAKRAAFLAFSIENLKMESSTSASAFSMMIEDIKLVQGELRPDITYIPSNWFQMNPDQQKSHFIQPCGGCQKITIRFVNNISSREFVTHFESSVELIWSPLAYVVFYEVYRKIHEISKTLSTPYRSSKKFSSRLLLTVVSDHPVDFGFRLPRNHFMRWVVPSIQLVKVDTVINVSAPTFLLEMDTHLILNLESPRIQRLAALVQMDMGRQEFRELQNRTNKLWWLHADTFQIVFPFKYDFSAAYEEVINSVKWIKIVHNHKPKKFTADSPLPSDLRVTFKTASLQMNDDPFEVQLQTIYEVMQDEVFERERRRQILEEKILEISKENPLFPKSKIDALYSKLAIKDAQIYVDRIRQVQQPLHRQLFLWTLKDFQLHAFADQSLHGKENVLSFMQHVNPESYLNGDGMEFSTMWCRAVELDVGESKMQFRDYPLPYSDIKEAYFFGFVAAAEHLTGDRSIRHEYIELPKPWGVYQINRNMCPLKFYYDLQCEITQLTAIYGPCWEPVLSFISLCWNYVNAPSRDPSPPLPFWDKIRLLLHGKFLMLCKKLTTSMLASVDPYNETELMDIIWENFGFEWSTGQFRIQSDVDVFIRTASKYDDSRLLHIPSLKWGINLDWICLGSPHDHHSATPVAPTKLPEYSTNIEHDSYRSFRSSHLDVSMNVEVKSPPEFKPSSNDIPQMLIYANTVKWFDFLKNTLTMVNRPIKRGSLFGVPHIKKAQLSRHLKHLNLSANVPRCMITYWMSFSSTSHGCRLFCENLLVTWGTNLQIIRNEDIEENIQRRPQTAWKTSFFSVQLENAQLQLYGANRQPEMDKFNITHENHRAFFLGFSRLAYLNSDDNSEHFLDASDHARHRLTIHDLRASWTVDNRDTCLAIMEGFQKAHLLKKVLSNDAMKILEFSQSQENLKSARQQQQQQQHLPAPVSKSPNRATQNSTDIRPPLHTTISSNLNDDGGASSLLWKLVGSMGENTGSIAYSEDVLERPDESLNGVALSKKNDVVQHNWQIDLLHSQVMLIGCEKDGFVLMTADHASLSNKVHTPVWRNAQLLLKKSWTASLSGMQYFAPLVIGKATINREHFRFVSRKIIQKQADDATGSDKIASYSNSGEAVGGIVVDDEDNLTGVREYQLQRVGSRCSCQMFFITFSDILNIEKFERLFIPKMNETSDDVLQKREDVDCFTLKHNMLEISTNSEQYQILLDIVNHLVLFVDPKKKQSEESRRRLWFKLAKISKEEVRDSIEKMQCDLRECVAIIRSLERQAFFLNRQQNGGAGTPQMIEESESLKKEIEESKARQLALIDLLAATISCFKEREIEEKSEIHRLHALHDDEESLISRRFEICFEETSWRLTENDGQISIAEMQIRNFLYTRTARIDNSGEHCVEVGSVKLDNLIPDSKYKEVLAKLPNPQAGNSDKTPVLRVICRELAPVGGICVKEHFEVNILPQVTQITYRFFSKMMAFFFPGRNIDKEDQQNLDKTDETQQPTHSTGSFALTRRLFVRNKTSTATSEIRSDEIDKMKERAEKNNVFVYIIIPQVTFVVSYKGNKDKNLLDVDRFTFTFPVCEYHDKNWTWLDLALALKQRCRRMLLQQFMAQKLKLTRIGGMPALIEPIDDEEKKRIALGRPLTIEEKTKKKSKA